MGHHFNQMNLEFAKLNAIKHVLVSPYHPASNGAAERSVRIVKESLKKQVLQGIKGMSMKHRLANVLLRYRTTPHSVTNCTPAELLMKRQLRTRLSLVTPDLAKNVEEKQIKQKLYFDQGKKNRQMNVGDNVFVRNMRGLKSTSEKWVYGVIVDVVVQDLILLNVVMMSNMSM